MSFDTSQLSSVSWRELLTRFAFGATVSAIADVIGWILGERVGGLLLAFPAILPATLTLIAKKDGEEKSFHDLQGTVCGACGLVGFGIVASASFRHFNILVVVLLALLAWTLTAGSMYLVWASWLRSRGAQL